MGGWMLRQVETARETAEFIGKSFGPVWLLVFVLLAGAGFVTWKLISKMMTILDKQSDTWTVEVPKVLAKNAEAQAVTAAALQSVDTSIRRSEERREEQHRNHVDAMQEVRRILERREK